MSYSYTICDTIHHQHVTIHFQPETEVPRMSVYTMLGVEAGGIFTFIFEV